MIYGPFGISPVAGGFPLLCLKWHAEQDCVLKKRFESISTRHDGRSIYPIVLNKVSPEKRFVRDLGSKFSRGCVNSSRDISNTVVGPQAVGGPHIQVS